MTDDVFDGRQPTLLIIDDLMSETNQLVEDIFTKISHHRNISVIYMTQNVFDKKNTPEPSVSTYTISSYSKILEMPISLPCYRDRCTPILGDLP